MDSLLDIFDRGQRYSLMAGLNPLLVKDPRFDYSVSIDPNTGQFLFGSDDRVRTSFATHPTFLADLDPRTIADDLWAVTRGGQTGTSVGDRSSPFFMNAAQNVVGNAQNITPQMVDAIRRLQLESRYPEIRQQHPGLAAYHPPGAAPFESSTVAPPMGTGFQQPTGTLGGMPGLPPAGVPSAEQEALQPEDPLLYALLGYFAGPGAALKTLAQTQLASLLTGGKQASAEQNIAGKAFNPVGRFLDTRLGQTSYKAPVEMPNVVIPEWLKPILRGAGMDIPEIPPI